MPEPEPTFSSLVQPADEAESARVLDLTVPDHVDDLANGDSLPAEGVAQEAVLRLSNGGSLQAESGPQGATALRFPAHCDDEPCPKAIIEVADTDDMTPGTRDFVFGATVKLPPGETASGANVLQKGFSTGGGGQWKLQIDGDGGIPSCVLVASGSEEIHVASGDRSVADGQWHELSCSREGDKLTLSIDGAVTGAIALPPSMLIVPSGPVRVGGKNLQPDNDQYSGAVAAVFLDVSTA